MERIYHKKQRKGNKANDIEFYLRIVLNLITKLQKENETLNIALNKQTINIRDNLLELQEKDKRINDLEFALLDMVMQFANRIKIKGSSYAFDTMGLSALELAFYELGFHEMYPVKRAEEKYKILEKQYFEKQAKEKENQYENRKRMS